MKKCIMVLVVVMLLTAGCMSMVTPSGAYSGLSTSINPKAEMIEFEGFQISKMESHDLENPSTKYAGVIHNGMLQSPYTGSTEWEIIFIDFENVADAYLMSLRIHATDWIFHNGRVFVKVDESLYKFVDPNPHRNVVSGDHVTESIWFEVGEDFIQDISEGGRVQIQLVGDPVTLTEEELYRFKTFLKFTKK